MRRQVRPCNSRLVKDLEELCGGRAGISCFAQGLVNFSQNGRRASMAGDLTGGCGSQERVQRWDRRSQLFAGDAEPPLNFVADPLNCGEVAISINQGMTVGNA